MNFFSPKPKKRFLFKERVLKVWKLKQKNLLKVVSDDVFPIFTIAKKFVV